MPYAETSSFFPVLNASRLTWYSEVSSALEDDSSSEVFRFSDPATAVPMVEAIWLNPIETPPSPPLLIRPPILGKIGKSYRPLKIRVIDRLRLRGSESAGAEGGDRTGFLSTENALLPELLSNYLQHRPYERIL